MKNAQHVANKNSQAILAKFSKKGCCLLFTEGAAFYK